jgi:hypothetical protein
LLVFIIFSIHKTNELKKRAKKNLRLLLPKKNQKKARGGLFLARGVGRASALFFGAVMYY